MSRLGFWLAADAWATFEAIHLSADALTALATQRLAGLLRLAAQAPFYGERFATVDLDVTDPALARDPERAFGALRALVPVTKTELRAAGTGVCAGGAIAAGWRSSRSSGSTGEPFRVYYDPRAWATLKYLVKVRARLECGMRLTDRVASLEAAPLAELDGRPVLSRMRRLLRLNVLRPAEELADALYRFGPDWLTGLPSALLETGQALGAGPGRFAVRGIFTGGELLARTTRQALEHTYGTRVFDVYGTSETKEIAWECRLGQRHVNADVLFVEIVDAAGRPLPPGHEGEIVVTVLVNHAMPLLRYRTGDWGSLLAERCPCGRATPLLGIVTGREADILVLAGRRISPYALTCALEPVPGLVRYQVLQLAPARVAVRAIASGDADRGALAGRIRGALRTHVAAALDVGVEFVDRLPTGPRAKFRVVQRMEAL